MSKRLTAKPKTLHKTILGEKYAITAVSHFNPGVIVDLYVAKENAFLAVVGTA